MYKQCKDVIKQTTANCVKRLSDGAIIPYDLNNTDYQAYLKWLDEGGVASPPDEVDNAV
jgi:hypothetical protein